MEIPLNTPQPLNRWSVTLFVLLVLSLVTMPVAVAYWPMERARWLLAAADNALDKSKEVGDAWKLEAQTLLDRALASDPTIKKSLEFARVDFRLHPEEVEIAIKLVLSVDPANQAHAADVLSEMRLEIRDFDAAYRILVAGYPGEATRNAAQRNNLAYYAALANRELEPALLDIEKALAEKKLELYEKAMYLDTKAWVLFRLNRFHEALASIDLSIADYGKNLEETPYKPAVRAVFHNLIHQEPPFVSRSESDRIDPLDQFHPQIQQIVKLVVVTHFHRAEILKNLGKTEEADLELAWLRDRGFNHFEQLY